uniref:B30.2/SPRY domain-containing protein n=1 Tax=Neogobius melanostomus TaxID=47308 RepID=A0A8C6S980_9GOBI
MICLLFQSLEKEILSFVKEQLATFLKLLASEHPEKTSEHQGSTSESEQERRNREAVFLANHSSIISILSVHSLSVPPAQIFLVFSETFGSLFEQKLRSSLQLKFSHVFEGVDKPGKSVPLHQIYTELYITEGEASEVNQEHEVRHIETMSRRPAEIPIACEDIFKQRPDFEKPIRTVMTTGVAGVGKTVLTQKFSLDWAEGRTNQDVQLLFPFTFRELSVLRDKEYSLVGLLHHFFGETKGLCSLEHLTVAFIFDGLDECRHSLDFTNTKALTEPTESASVEELLVNLIRGSLLPSARLWITTRPAAANQIPSECVSMVTEVRGFNDPQKEEYFRKRFRDEQQATAVIAHIKSIRSLYIMSYIPVFCWILSTVFEHVLKTKQRGELPKTLTQMYIHFLVVQAKVKNIKYEGGSETDPHWSSETRKMVRSLGKLAFEQLQKGNLIFYESDLSECGLDAAEFARYSGVFTEVFKEEPGQGKNKIYCFIHLSVQEFLAALHVHLTFFSGEKLLSEPKMSTRSKSAFYCSAVDRALQSPNGHLDLFLRFLLGLSLPTNQSLLQGLLTQTGGSSRTNREILGYIKEKLNNGVSAERSLNLLHCLNELNDSSLVEEIQQFMREGCFSERHMSAAQWSAVAFLLLSSDLDQEEFDLRKYDPSEEVLLSPDCIETLIMTLLANCPLSHSLSICNLSTLSCAPLATVLSSSSLKHLDLSDNNLWDSGVELLCEGLKSAPCGLWTLSLSGCLVSEKGGASLASALSSATSHLRELDLRYNHPGASTELLTALQDQPNLSFCCICLSDSCELSLDPNTAQRNLLLSDDKRTVSRVKEKQQYPDHEDRFRDQPQVLSSTGLSGRCYWEVQWSGRCIVIALSYRGIRRRGDGGNFRFGDNAQSWSFRISGEHYYACHNEKEKMVSPRSPTSGRVGVLLDTKDGYLSFYEVNADGNLTHLHTFTSTFTEPLFPGFRLRSFPSSVTIKYLKTLTNRMSGPSPSVLHSTYL